MEREQERKLGIILDAGTGLRLSEGEQAQSCHTGDMSQ